MLSLFCTLSLCYLSREMCNYDLHLQNSFMFSLVWSIGASVDTDSRPMFDSFLRELLAGNNNNHPVPASIGKIDNSFPNDALVYDFLFEVSQTRFVQ